jgi:helix-turn-helix protein
LSTVVRLHTNTVPATDDRLEELPTLITTEELAALLRVDPSTVRRWRTSHPIQGPPFMHLSERVTKYHIDDVRAWLAQHRVVPGAAA